MNLKAIRRSIQREVDGRERAFLRQFRRRLSDDAKASWLREMAGTCDSGWTGWDFEDVSRGRGLLWHRRFGHVSWNYVIRSNSKPRNGVDQQRINVISHIKNSRSEFVRLP